METTVELPPRPQPKRPIWRLPPAPQTQEAWQALVQHPRNIEIAIIIISILALPFSIIASLKFHYFLVGGIVSCLLTVLSSAICLWLYTKRGLACTTSLIRSVIFLIGWLIGSASARYTYNYWDDNDTTVVSFTSAWSVLVRSIFYWSLCVTFFIYLVISGIATHRDRHRRRYEQYRMQGGPYPQAPYGAPPPGQTPPREGYYPGPYAPPPGPPPPQYA